MSGLERVGGETRYEGRIVSVREETFRYPDGGTAEREVVVHPGAVAVVAHDDEHVYLVRQPREPVEEAALLELPAGKLDAEGESPLEAMKRELVEEIDLDGYAKAGLPARTMGRGLDEDPLFFAAPLAAGRALARAAAGVPR